MCFLTYNWQTTFVVPHFLYLLYKIYNKITVKVISSKEKLISVLKQKGFTSGRIFTLDDYYKRR